jgi:TonB-linked SusC/RagA family outer membrane protein
MLALALCGTALAQQVRVSGFVTTMEGTPLEGVIVWVQGTDTRTTTDRVGRYTIAAPGDGVLIFNLIGYRALGLDISGRATLDVIMERAVAVLDEVIVTGYMEQRRADITGAVSSVDVESVTRQTGSSVLKALDGRVSGVTVDASGSPGSRNTVRIRGFSSFQNNDPLYIVDGTPVEGTYFNWLNPNDIESMQVLKDASAASIYGSRATNGVIIIETRKRGTTAAPRFSIDTRFGMATPVRGLDDFLMTDALEYHEFLKRTYENAGLAVPENIFGDPDSPTIPAYIWPNDGITQTTNVDESTYVYGDPTFQNGMIMPGSPGTNWWDAVFGTGLVADVNLALSGSGEAHGYNVSFNYLNQEGTALYNLFQRYSARANTEFSIGRFRIGENLAVAFERAYGGLDDGAIGEDGIMGKDILMQPVVPVYDIGGNFAGGKAVTLGNQSNPVWRAWGDKDDVNNNLRIFGNVFAGFELTPGLEFTSRFGVNLTESSVAFYNPINPAHSEPTFTNSIGENYDLYREWTWSNTLAYSTVFNERHNVDVLVGQEANKGISRGNGSSISSLINPGDLNARYIQDALGDADSKNVFSYGGRASLASFFGKLDYNYAQRYHLTFTLRRDGSSRLGPTTRWGTFPAFSLGWRLSEEPFMRQKTFFTNVMLRFGWGVTGNQAIPSGRIVSQFGGGSGDTFYDITGSETNIVPGYRQTSLGNPNLKWEGNTSMNAGLDLEFFGGAASLVVDAFQRETENLLFDPATPSTAGVAAPPIVNIGKMRNRGFDFSLGYTGAIGSGSWRVSVSGSHYKNEIRYIDGVQDEFYGTSSGARYGFTTINRLGESIGSFYGLIADGFFEDDAAVAAHATQDGAAPGRIRFKDIDGRDPVTGERTGEPDGVINADDRTVIGSPHPDFTAGLDFSLEWGAWDLNATVFGTFGNEIWDLQKQFYVFYNFSTNVRRDLLTDSWTPETAATAKYPRLDRSDTFSGQQPSTFYVEDGSYVRLRNLQIGYRIPESWIPDTRIYVQAENLLTLTGYPGLDPALPALAYGGAGGDVRDQYRGMDRGSYPSNKTISFGISARF